MLWPLVLLIALLVMADALRRSYVMTWGDLYLMFRRARAHTFRILGFYHHGRRN